MITFSNVCDRCRIANGGPMGHEYAVTITTRQKFSNIDKFRKYIYDTLSGLYYVDVIPEYHNNAISKLHAHGYWYSLDSNPMKEYNGKINVKGLTMVFCEITDNNLWRKYCLKELDHTLDWENDIQNGTINIYKLNRAKKHKLLI